MSDKKDRPEHERGQSCEQFRKFQDDYWGKKAKEAEAEGYLGADASELLLRESVTSDDRRPA